MLSLLLTMAFLARQAWGWVADRIGGLNTVLAGNVFQVVGMAAFMATQDEAGLFLVAALFGLGFSGIVPAYVLTVRELFPSAEAAWRVPCLLFLSLSGMAAGAWLAGICTTASAAMRWPGRSASPPTWRRSRSSAGWRCGGAGGGGQPLGDDGGTHTRSDAESALETRGASAAPIGRRTRHRPA